jgi:rare lipoprotein A
LRDLHRLNLVRNHGTFPRISTNNKECDMTLASKTLAAAALVLGGTCAAVSGAEATSIQSGGASWYGPGFHGKKTASGERFNTRALTAAHKHLPFGTKVRVTNERTGRSVVVRINDRGPFVGGRVIDLSKAAAQAVGISGIGKVKLSRL